MADVTDKKNQNTEWQSMLLSRRFNQVLAGMCASHQSTLPKCEIPQMILRIFEKKRK